MSKKEREKTYFNPGPLLKLEHESLLVELKEQAVNAAIDERVEFEKNLLQLAQEIKDENKRSAVYEVLVSLQTLWNQHKPEKGLQEKFRFAFDSGDYKEAEEIYKRLAKQGLDYIEIFQTEKGKLVPVINKEKAMLVLYNERELIFYSLQFEQLAKFVLPGGHTISDLIVPPTCLYPDGDPGDESEDGQSSMWLLLIDKKCRKLIASAHIGDFRVTKKDLESIEQRAIYLEQKLKNSHSLSYFKNHLLVIAEKSIHYYGEKGTWEQWYSTGKEKVEITAFASIKEGFWIGLSNGDVIILKKLQYVGVRAVFKGFPEPIKSIRAGGKYVLISGEYYLSISDYTGNQISKMFASKCRITQAVIINDNDLLTLHANGILVSREIKQENKRWQINLSKAYYLLFFFDRYVYCGNGTGETSLFALPAFHTLAKELESHGVHVQDQSAEMEPTAPVRIISEFVGRTEILAEIKKSKDHFLLVGEPLIGKTSLLNVLGDTLADNARSCIVDMAKLLDNSGLYDIFETELIDVCVKQHYLNFPDLAGKTGFPVLKAMIKRIRGDRNFCIICMDNFSIPTRFDDNNKEKFKTLLHDMIQLPDVRLIFACNLKHIETIRAYFDDFKDIFRQRKLSTRHIPLLSEGEVKKVLREKVSLKQSVVDQVYKYTGRFPHLIRLYDRWQPDGHSIEEYSRGIAQNFGEKIFEYFRDLSLNARLLIVTCLYENLISEKVSFATLYEKFPFIKNSIPEDQLKESIREIAGYGSGLSVEEEEKTFKIKLNGNAQLFYEAAKHIPWIKDFESIYEFTSAPDQQIAHNVAQLFTRITGSTLEIDTSLEKRIKKFKGKFYVNKLTEKGLKILRMPLSTFVVVSVKPWQKESHKETFRDLIIEFQEFNRQAGESQMFYVLLLAPQTMSKEKIRENLKGFDRISIIDAVMLKEIILANSPHEKASRYIFEQLSIKERSPYTISGAVPDSLFFGREMEIALIRDLPENIGVFGVRTIGKTSLLRKLQKALHIQKGWKVFDMDCGRIESEEALLKNLAEKMGIPSEDISDLDKFRRYVTREAEKDGHRFLFLLDEVDRLVEYDMRHDERIFNTFNRLCNEATQRGEVAARFILFGFHQMWQQMKNPESRLYNFMVFLPLQALDKDGAMGLVTQPIEKIQVMWKNKEDAEYLVDHCSRHPRLLQAACHALLNILDSKLENRNIIERKDVDQALNSDRFREICMRLYHVEEKPVVMNKKKEHHNRGATFFKRIWWKNRKEGRDKDDTKDEFLGDIHRITILTAIHLLSAEEKEIFNITDIQKKLKEKGIDISPDVMRNVLDRLCLSGNFRLIEEPTIITKEGPKVLQKVEITGIDASNREVTHFDVKVNDPNVYFKDDMDIPKLTYKFGVKIFPKLLAAQLGGYEKCQEECRRLIKKGLWREYLKRF